MHPVDVVSKLNDRVRRMARRWDDLIWVAVLLAVLIWRWPILKGYYYRLANVQAEASAIDWHTDLSTALDEARRTGRPVLADFNATWCPPCAAMKHDTWTDDDVERAVSASTVPLLVDIDRDPATASRYGIEAVPTVLLLDGNGTVIRRAGFLPASGVLRFLDGD